MENKIVLARFKDGYGPVGAWFLLLKSYATNAYGEKYEASWFDQIKSLVGKYARHQADADLPAKSRDDRGDEGRQGPHLHANTGGSRYQGEGRNRLGRISST